MSGEFIEDADGSIWVSHWQKGIYHLVLDNELKNVKHTEHFHKGNGLLVDELNIVCKIQGRTYISTVDGLYSYDSKKRKLTLDNGMSRIFNKFGVPLNIYETPDGDLWAYTEKYLALAQRQKNGRYKVDSISYKGMVNRLQPVGRPGLTAHQTLLNSQDGFFVASRQEQFVGYKSKVFVRRIYSTNKRDSLLMAFFPSNNGDAVRVDHDNNSLRIEYVMPEYRDPNAVTYSCRLEGYDKHWSTPQTANYTDYTHLPKGEYVFHVKAHNRLTGQNDEFRQTIIILPAWYETWWAYLIYIIIGVLTVRMLILYLKKRADRELLRMRKEKERQLREQEREFQMEQAQKDKQLAELRNEQLNLNLKQKAGQLADSTINLVRKNEMLQEIDQSMFELSEDVKHNEPATALQRRIKNIRRSIEMNMGDDKNWQKFEENFNLVYDNFMQRLTEHYPELKMNDRKLCAYLRMDLSSKEIASLMNCSERSVETARYRLRKKLQMEKGDNLTTFLQNF